MTALALDTLRISRRLREVGFSEPQAEAVTSVLSDARETSLSELATKADLRESIATLKSELKADIAELRSEFKIESSVMKADILLLKWMAGVNSAMMIAILLKLFTA